MMRSAATAAALLLGLGACAEGTATDYRPLSFTAPGNQPVQQVATLPTPVDPDRAYGVEWSCVWDVVPETWSLPGLQISGDRAFAVNEWTRLSGRIRPYAGSVGKLRLDGERLSDDGNWYPMELKGIILPDRQSTLVGYWKGATCEATVTPQASDVGAAG